MFGDIVNGEMRQNEYGRLVSACWSELPGYYTRVGLDELVVMPNHVHGVIVLRYDDHDPVRAGLRPALTKSARVKRYALPDIIRGFKAFASRRINRARDTSGAPVWQRNYYERVIRNESELDAVRQYIRHNPATWSKDADNPANLRRP